MQVHNLTGHDKVDQAISHFLNSAPKFIQAIKELPIESKDFTYTTKLNWRVAKELEQHFNSSFSLEIKTFRPFNPWSRVIGYTKGTNEIFVNERKLPYLDYQEIAGNIAHEFCHHPCGFRHGSNYITDLKKLSVPYAFGYLISGKSTFPLVKYREKVTA